MPPTHSCVLQVALVALALQLALPLLQLASSEFVDGTKTCHQSPAVLMPAPHAQLEHKPLTPALSPVSDLAMAGSEQEEEGRGQGGRSCSRCSRTVHRGCGA